MTRSTYTNQQLVAMARRRELLQMAVLALRELMWQLPSGTTHPLVDPLIDKGNIKPLYAQLVKYRNWYDIEFDDGHTAPLPSSADIFVERQ